MSYFKIPYIHEKIKKNIRNQEEKHQQDVLQKYIDKNITVTKNHKNRKVFLKIFEFYI